MICFLSGSEQDANTLETLRFVKSINNISWDDITNIPHCKLDNRSMGESRLSKAVFAGRFFLLLSAEPGLPPASWRRQILSMMC